MAANLATLGFAVDSSGLLSAKAALDGLTASARPAAAAATNLGAAATKAASAHAGLSASGAAAAHSIRAMAEELALGVPPTQILTQQLAHLSFAASGPQGLKGAFAEAAGAFKQFLTPMTLVVGGLAAVGAGAYLALSSIKATELQFGDLSERIGTSVGKLHDFESAAAFKGISTDDFLKGMQKFGDLSQDALHNTGSLADLFRANGVAVGDVNQNLLKSADLIENASSEAEKYRIIQELGLPATRQWVQLLSQGSDGIKDAIDQSVKLGQTTDEQLIAKARKADEEWNTFWHNFGTRGKAAIIEAQSGISGLDAWLSSKFNAVGNAIGGANDPLANAKAMMTLGRGSQLSLSDAHSFYAATGANGTAAGAGTAKPTVNDSDVRLEMQRAQTRIGILGQTPTVAQSTAKDDKQEKEADRDSDRYRSAA